VKTFHPKYNYEVHIATYSDFDWATLPKPFFVNEVRKPNQISSIVTAETKRLPRALALFEEIKNWCAEKQHFQTNGCRITLEEMVWMTDIDSRNKNRLAIEHADWQIDGNAYVPFSDVHADGAWDRDLYLRLVNERGYLPLDYVTRHGKELSVLTLHFREPSAALDESAYLTKILLKGGFSGTLSVENSIEVAVIGPTNPRPVITNR
jgi:hypothetical protein